MQISVKPYGVEKCKKMTPALHCTKQNSVTVFNNCNELQTQKNDGHCSNRESALFRTE